MQDATEDITPIKLGCVESLGMAVGQFFLRKRPKMREARSVVLYNRKRMKEVERSSIEGDPN